MNKTLKTIIVSILFILAAGWGIMWYLRKTIAPEMKFQNSELLLTGSHTKTTIDDLKGNVVIVSFFQTWCGPCIQEMYVFEELLATVNSPGFKILCISDEDTVRINKVKSRFAPGKIIFAHSPEKFAGMGIHVYPTTYLLNKNGEAVQSKLEGYNWAQEKATIDKLLSQ
jgi:thiol-disulfide isomerase/thioredoxin